MLEIALLGSPQIHLDGEPIEFATNKAVALLAYLATTSSVSRRNSLANLLWPDYGQQRLALRQAIFVMKKGIGDSFLKISRETINLVKDVNLLVDTYEVSRLIESIEYEENQINCHHAQSLLSQAASLYRGEFLEGFSLPDSPNFDEWQSLEASRYQRERIKILEKLAYCHESLGDLPTAITHTHTLAALEPYEELYYRNLMHLYAQTDRRAKALEIYQACVEILDRELNAEPTDETQQLFEAIQAGLISPSAGVFTQSAKTATGETVRAQLYDNSELIIEKPSRLIGRDDLVKTIGSLCEEKENVLLTGFGGVGKTSLAATVAANYLESQEGNVFWVEMGHATTAAILETIARALGRHQAILDKNLDEQIALIRKYLVEHELLVVLDNIWNERELFQVLKIIPPSTPTILTSRFVIPVEGEVIYITGLSMTNAIELLAHHSRRDFQQDTEAQTLCEKLSFHPFAIEIAGKRLKAQPNLSLLRLMQNVDEAPHRIRLPSEFGEIGREGIRDLLDVSVGALTDDLRHVLVQMGAFPAPRASLELMSYFVDSASQTIWDQITELQRYGLADVIDGATLPLHYRLHDLTHSYAKAIFRQETADIVPFITAIQNFVQAHPQNYDLLDFELDNILEAARLASKTDHKPALINIMKVILVDGYLDNRGHTMALLKLADLAIAAAREVKERYGEDLHYMLSKRGNAYAQRADLGNALIVYLEAVDIAPDLHRKARMLNVVGGVRYRQGANDYDQYFEQAYQIAEKEKDYEILTLITFHRGLALAESGDPNASRIYLLEAVETAKHLGDSLVYLPLYNLGVTERDLGNYDEALSIHYRTLDIANRIGNEFWTADSISAIGCDFDSTHDRENAQKRLQQALTLYKKIGAKAKIDWVIDFMLNAGYDVPHDLHAPV